MDLNFKFYNQHNIESLSSDVHHFIRTLDIYYQPEFLQCDAKHQNGHYEIAVTKYGEQIWVYPYLVIPIPNTNWFDLASPYGYAGPVSNSPELFKLSELEFLDRIKSRSNIITEFVRYHYQYNAHSKFEHEINNQLNREIFLLPTKNHEEVWTKHFSGTNRNIYRKMQSEQFEFTIDAFRQEDIHDFQEAYHKTMNHLNASNFYYFSNSYFEDIQRSLKENLLIARVKFKDVVYATALFFKSNKTLTYFLSARNLDFPKVAATNFLLSNAAFWAEKNNFNHLNFGGGMSMDPKDSLLKFKSQFTTEKRPFFIGKRIHQQNLYEELVALYKAQFGSNEFDKVKHILQFYR